MFKASYTVEGIRGIQKGGGSARRVAVDEIAKSVGGTIESFYFAFGDDDVYLIADLPDNKAAAAIVLAVGASGAVALKTVVLLSPEEIDGAAERTVAYRPPG